MSNAAPGIDEYEKSVFLTKAQEEIVQAIYDGSFEGSERMRESLGILVETKKYLSSEARELVSTLNADSKVFDIPGDLMFIVYEELDIALPEGCSSNSRKVLVKPVTHDEYYRAINNPFRKPRKREAFRLNVSNLNNSSKIDTVEIIYPSEFCNNGYTYLLRYIRRPKPIIITDLSDIASGLTIDGEHDESECELNTILHRAIVNRAVQLAISAYKTVSQKDNK